MDPAKCLEILSNRMKYSDSHDAPHSPTDLTPSQAASEMASTAVGRGGGGGGQVINLATGSNETHAAAEAASSLMSAAAAAPPDRKTGGLVQEPPARSGAAPYAESDACGGADDSGESTKGGKPSVNGTNSDDISCGGAGAVAGASANGDADSMVTQENAAGKSGSVSTPEPTTEAAAARPAPAQAPPKAGGCTATAADDDDDVPTPAAIGGREGALEGMEGMSAGALVASFRRAQEERVALYRKFNGGLKEALRSGDYSGYPALCCEVTAGFSVLSKAINAVETVLGAAPETKPLAGIIRRVQEHEKEKLTVTAAHHLESMRQARALGMGPGMTVHPGGGGGGGGGDTVPASSSQERLLDEGVGDLSRRAEAEAAAVTELLEELRYEAEDLR